MRKSVRLLNETSTKKHGAIIYYDGIPSDEDPADYIRMKSIKAVRLG